MAIFTKTGIRCDRCGLEQEGNCFDGTIRVYAQEANHTLGQAPWIEWHDLCSACSHQIRQQFQQWMIE